LFKVTSHREVARGDLELHRLGDIPDDVALEHGIETAKVLNDEGE